MFLPKEVSINADKKLDYWSRKRPFRLPDELVYSAADRNQVIEFTHSRGAVLFIESSACFHFGSGNSVKPRFQLMLRYTGARRTDLSELYMAENVFSVRDSDSRLRKMLLNKNILE
jgi:hypothetical protein